MVKISSLNDTIAAIATSPGQGSIGIVRMSGPQALAIADAIVRSPQKRLPSAQPPLTVSYGWVMDGNQTVDEVLLTVFRGPKSYTGQDLVEINCHGGTVVLRNVLTVALKHGARLAEPGEFTKRAFLNGRMDLTQAEAVLDVIQAKTSAFARVSQNQLQGQLRTELSSIRSQLMDAYTRVEAVINFPEDDTAQDRTEISRQLTVALEWTGRLIASSSNGRILREGIKIVLCGKPNVGKSSLLNKLLRTERAIVSHIAGTTRDVIEETAQLKGIAVQLADTAGILEPRDLIEQEAIKRSYLLIDAADLVLLVLDGSRPLEQADQLLIDRLKDRNHLTIVNKSDLPQKLNRKMLAAANIISLSALDSQTIDPLESAIIERVWQGTDSGTHAVVVNNVRHVEALRKAQELLTEGVQLCEQSVPLELVSQNIKEAVNCLDQITGRNIDADLLESIFSQFCIGK